MPRNAQIKIDLALKKLDQEIESALSPNDGAAAYDDAANNAKDGGFDKITKEESLEKAKECAKRKTDYESCKRSPRSGLLGGLCFIQNVQRRLLQQTTSS